jgi:hypothetical protein
MVAGRMAELDVDRARVIGEALAGDGVDAQGQGLILTQYSAVENPHSRLILFLYVSKVIFCFSHSRACTVFGFFYSQAWKDTATGPSYLIRGHRSNFLFENNLCVILILLFAQFSPPF